VPGPIEDLSDLTLVLSAYNAELTVGATLRSLHHDLVRGMRMILVDDASTDGTADVLRAISEAYSGIEVIVLDANKGAGPARNLGLDKVETSFVGLIDADDWVRPGYHGRMLAALAADDGLDFVVSHHLRSEGVKRTAHRVPCANTELPVRPRNLVLPVFRNTMVDYVLLPMYLFRRDFLDRYAIRYGPTPTAEDRVFNWKAVVLARQMLVLEEYGYIYRRDNVLSLTRQGDMRQLGFVDAVEGICSFLVENGDDELLPKAHRQLLSLTFSHLDRPGHLRPATARALRLRARQALARLSRAQLEAAIAGMDTHSRRRARQLHSG
jgi:glycosyltransferase involved in cell wall biosynthesis